MRGLALLVVRRSYSGHGLDIVDGNYYYNYYFIII